ncbi:serine integrase [Mycobacterium phage Chupacabra]|uniref:Serine integrase n=2 Tax=Fromanvirus goose TaxID=1211282 RepID=A0A291AUY4_9CAUD|nr:serine integrase [Mycobacterium phage OKCentral2016]QHB41216.1 serine integrase [Mycobacterium phage Chupacabra]
MRVLGRLRLSRSTEESTSIERQREIVTAWAQSNGHTLVGWAEDVDVSGAIDPFDTPSLGPWLDERRGEWDILCAWKLDRLGRDAIRLNKLFGWCQEHGKTVASCSEGIDLSTPVGRLIANVIAFLAEGEREAIRERVTSSKQKLREVGRWGGGKPPFGYMGVPNPDGQGHILVVDPVAKPVVRRIVDDILDGKPLTRLCTELTEERYLTPAEYYATLKAGAPRQKAEPDETPAKWRPTALRNLLRSKALRGYAHHKGQTVRDLKGQPVRLAEPLVDADEWELLQEILDRVQANWSGRRVEGVSPLSGVAVCITCDRPLHHDRYLVKRPYGDYPYRYYRCRDRHGKNLPAELVETLMEESFLARVGDYPVRERVWVQGDTNWADLKEAVAAYDELVQAAGRAKSATAKERLQRQLDALDERIAELESAPATEAHWEYRPTGGTYRDAWETADTDERREILRRSGIVLAVGVDGVEGRRSKHNPGALHFDFRVPEELTQRLGVA